MMTTKTISIDHLSVELMRAGTRAKETETLHRPAFVAGPTGFFSSRRKELDRADHEHSGLLKPADTPDLSAPDD
jgi:hypothetical protein